MDTFRKHGYKSRFAPSGPHPSESSAARGNLSVPILYLDELNRLQFRCMVANLGLRRLVLDMLFLYLNEFASKIRNLYLYHFYSWLVWISSFARTMHNNFGSSISKPGCTYSQVCILRSLFLIPRKPSLFRLQDTSSQGFEYWLSISGLGLQIRDASDA